jgi:hypothetical protein
LGESPKTAPTGGQLACLRLLVQFFQSRSTSSRSMVVNVVSVVLVRIRGELSRLY